MRPYDIEKETRMTDRYAAFIICILVILLLLTSCAGTRTVTRTLTEYRDRWRVDSVLVEKRDSVYVAVATRNDTVFSTLEKWRVEYRDRLVRDTVTLDREVPVPVEVEKVVYVEKELSFFQNLFIQTGRVAVVFVLLYLLYLFYRRK